VLSYGYAETYWLQIKEYTFASPDVPDAFDGTRVILLTDIHRGGSFSQERVRQMVDQVSALRPDLVILGGDYVLAQTEYADSCFAELARLRAPLGVFAVLGNQDYGEYDDDEGGPGLVVRAAGDAGIPLLRNEGVWIEKDGSRFRLGGVEDLAQGQPQITPIISGTTPGDFVLVACHNPDYSEQLPADAVDLVLSGHTHGGQVTAFGLWAFHLPSEYGQKYRTGMVRNEVTTVIVSNGIGTSTRLPIRILARPQIVVVTLRSVPSSAIQP